MDDKLTLLIIGVITGHIIWIWFFKNKMKKGKMRDKIILLYNRLYINDQDIAKLVEQFREAGTIAFALPTSKELNDSIEVIEVPSSHVLND